MSKVASFVFILFSIHQIARANDVETVVVTATRTESQQNEIGSDMSVLPGNQIRELGTSDLGNALSTTPGVYTNSSGGAGQIKSVFIRGAKSEGTLVMINGIVVNDVSSPSRGFSFSNLGLDNIDHVEVVRGSQSVLYGSDAIGGVINIITKDHAKSEGSVLLGSYHTLQGNIQSGGVSASFIRSGGYSAADSQLGNTEPDGYKRNSFSAQHEFSLSPNTKLKLFGLYIESLADTDANSGVGGDKIGSSGQDEFFAGGLTLSHLTLNDSLKLTTGAHINTHDRSDNTFGNSFYSGSWNKEFLQGELLNFENQNLIFGIENSNEMSTSTGVTGTHNVSTEGIFAEAGGKWGPAFYSLGGRSDTHTTFGSYQTYRVVLGDWLIPQILKFKTSYGTGFKAPSLYQLYSSFGNTNLQPSESSSQDAGIETRIYFAEELTFEINAFRNRFHNYIDYSFSMNKYANIAESLSEGFEFIFSWTHRPVKIENSLTALHSTNLVTGTSILQIPSQTNSLSLFYNSSESLQFMLNWRFVSSRDDIDAIGNGMIMPSYSVVTAHAEKTLTKDLSIIGHIDNLFDQIYESVCGYGTARLSVYLGMKAAL